MEIEKAFDAIHSWTKKNKLLQYFTAFTRIILAIGFIPPSLKKILNQPFTIIPDSHPVGHYFNALYATGFYYQFIGWSQLIAAILLLFPRTAHLGALMFLPIIVNITVLTNSVGFVGTKYITILMSLAAIYLVCWDYDRWKSLLFVKRHVRIRVSAMEFLVFPIFFSILACAGISFLAWFSVGNLHQDFLYKFSIVTIGGFLFGAICALHHKFMKSGELENIE